MIRITFFSDNKIFLRCYEKIFEFVWETIVTKERQRNRNVNILDERAVIIMKKMNIKIEHKK